MLMHRCTGIFDLVFQPNLVCIKQIKNFCSVFKCSARTARNIVTFFLHFNPSRTNESSQAFHSQSLVLVRRHLATAQDRSGHCFSRIHGYKTKCSKIHIQTYFPIKGLKIKLNVNLPIVLFC